MFKKVIPRPVGIAVTFDGRQVLKLYAMFLQIFETAKQNGGGTFDICAGEHNPQEGFAVSLRDFEERFTHLSQSYMMDYVARHMSRFAVYGDYFGVWYDSETKEWVFDVTAIIPDREQAIVCGELNNQKAIWDCANQSEIRLSILVS